MKIKTKNKKKLVISFKFTVILYLLQTILSRKEEGEGGGRKEGEVKGLRELRTQPSPAARLITVVSKSYVNAKYIPVYSLHLVFELRS